MARRRCCSCRPSFVLSRTWKYPRLLIALLVLELAGTVAALALFGIADPNTFRTKMWQVGSENNFNSDPRQQLYAYANHRPIPSTPFVWSRSLTTYNIVVSVLSMFILLIKLVMFVMHIWYPLLGGIVNLALTALWVVSVYGQAGPDHSDPSARSNVAWYVTKSCSYAERLHWGHYCRLAKGTFAVTVFMLAIFFFNLLLSIYSLIPSRAARAAGKLDYDEHQATAGSSSSRSYSPSASQHYYSPSSEKGHEMQSTAMHVHVPIPEPYTPRTEAFHTLSGNGGGRPGGGAGGATRSLPFRNM